MRIRYFNTAEPVFPFFRDLAPFFAERGAQVEIVISDSEYRDGQTPLRDVLPSLGIELTCIPVGKKATRGWLQRIRAAVIYAGVAMARTLLGHSVDINCFLTQPPLFYLWGYALKCLRSQKFYVLVMDLYPDVAIQSGVLKPGALPTYLLTILSRFALKRADKIIVIGRCMQEHLEKGGILSERITVLPNWVDEHDVYPVSREANSLIRELNLNQDFIILYSGNLGIAHYFTDLIEVAVRTRHITDLHFVFIGSGARRKEIEDAQVKYDLSNVLLLPAQPIERLAQSLSMGDVHFISLRDGFEGLMVPSKAYGALGVGRPIIYQGNSSGEIARVIQEWHVGTVVPLNDPDTLEKKILTYYYHRDLASQQGAHALKASQTSFHRLTALNAYYELFVNQHDTL